jgi:hypothetical protein
LPHNLPATLSANLPTGWWRRHPERQSFVFAWRSLKRPSRRCGRNWQKSSVGAKRPNGSATTYVENCTPSESRENPPRRARSSRVGESPTPMPQALRRPYSARGGADCSEGDGMETFSLGDTIRVELDLRDESGVSTVSAAFYELNSGVGFMMRGESEGEHEVTVALLQEVTNEILPGEYRCEGVTLYDTHLNRKTLHPDIRFRVENIPGDHEGPELLGWRVSKE